MYKFYFFISTFLTPTITIANHVLPIDYPKEIMTLMAELADQPFDMGGWWDTSMDVHFVSIGTPACYVTPNGAMLIALKEAKVTVQKVCKDETNKTDFRSLSTSVVTGKASCNGASVSISFICP